MTALHRSLLPNGLKDLLSPEAEEEARIINSLMQSFRQFGYRRVKPPLIEFEDNLLAPGPGATLSKNTFRLMDPESGNMMGIRADVTAQIARLAGSRLKDVTRPLRVSYAADVLRVHGTQLRPERQFSQVGCELIGAHNVKDDVEVCLVALGALGGLGLKDISIDLSFPTLVSDIFKSYRIDGGLAENIDLLLNKRDRDGISGLDHEVKGILLQLIDGSGKIEDAIPRLSSIKAADNTITDSVDELIDIYNELTTALDAYGLTGTSITVDLIERKGLEYKSGFGFTLFSKHARGELGRGGRYYPSDDSNEQATGFTLYMDSVTQVVSKPDGDKTEYVDENTTWQDIKTLQDQGLMVNRGKKEG